MRPLTYDGRVTDATLTAAALAAALERLQLRPPDVQTVPAAMHGEVELLCARIASITELLRADPAWSDATRVAARLLLADVAAVAAQFRADTNESAGALARTLDSIRSLLDRAAS